MNVHGRLSEGVAAQPAGNSGVHSKHPISYRADIDGLRALAVIPVVLFHLGLPIFTGGYVGVDVFFVISGYLITRIISKELSSKDFSIGRFYERRFRRIMPALFTVMAVTGVASWFILLPQDFAAFGKSVVAASLFASNILFWRESGYFDTAADLKPLIHTWSLAVEEQYYIFFPLVLAALWKWARGRVVHVISALAVASFVISCIGVALGWSGAYYLLPSRAWELLVGSLLALAVVPAITHRWLREIVGILALAAIIVPALVLTSASPFPGYNALLPVIGSAVLLYLGANRSAEPALATRLLAMKPMVAVGLISYSLYLWHWPVIVLTKYLTLGQLDGPVALAVFGASVALAWSSWRYIEGPFRRRSMTRAATFKYALLATVAALIGGGSLVAAQGAPGRFPEVAELNQRIDAQQAEDIQNRCTMGEDGLPWRGPENCFLTNGPGTRILLWGDSHAGHFVPALREMNGQVKGTILAYGMTACTPIFGLPSAKRPNCIAAKERVFELIRQHRIERVVIAGYWYSAAENVYSDASPSLADTVARLRAAGVEVVVVGDSPSFYLKEPAFLLSRAIASGDIDAPVSVPYQNDDPHLNARIRQIAGADQFFDPLEALCEGSECLAFDEGEPLFIDFHHFSRFGARRMIAAMGPIFD